MCCIAGKKQKRGKLYLCREDEENIAAWYQEHDIFYRKDHRDYRYEIHLSQVNTAMIVGANKSGTYNKSPGIISEYLQGFSTK